MENRVIGINTGIGLRKRCNIKNSFFPSVNPVIDNLSAYESKQNQFKEIYIYGSNFQYQNTYFNFGPKQGLRVSFLDSRQLSVAIPNDLPPGSYSLEVYVIYNKGTNPYKIYSNEIAYKII